MVQIVKGSKGGGKGGESGGGGGVLIPFHASRYLKKHFMRRESKKNWGFQKWKKKFTGHVSLLFIDSRITLAFQIKLLP